MGAEEAVRALLDTEGWSLRDGAIVAASQRARGDPAAARATVLDADLREDVEDLRDVPLRELLVRLRLLSAKRRKQEAPDECDEGGEVLGVGCVWRPEELEEVGQLEVG